MVLKGGFKMHNVMQVQKDLYYIGVSDRRLSLFENIYPIPRGVSYNSYLLMDEKTVLLDTVEKTHSHQFLENIRFVLQNKPLDYVVVHHMEPDHSSTLLEIIHHYPQVKVICNEKILKMIHQFFDLDLSNQVVLVQEGQTLSFGKHQLAFVMAPMVHWPEVMVSYDTTTKTLFSADAFGTFGALSGNIFADEVDFEKDWLEDARRYYTNIVGKYGNQVQALLKKSESLEIEMICPLHGPIWRKNLNWFIDKYLKWATYTPEEKRVLIVYGSIYGNTENAASILASKLAQKGIQKIAMYDVSMTHPSYLVAEAFRCSHLVLACSTYNAGIFSPMETFVLDLVAHNLQNRTVAIIENGSWAPTAKTLLTNLITKMKNITLLNSSLTFLSSLKKEQEKDLDALVNALCDSLKGPENKVSENTKIDNNAMFKLSYGLFVLTAKENKKDNGCIINTVMQVTDNPKQVAIAVNKVNYTHDMIVHTKKFNVSILTTETPFKVFQHFGFQSGKEVNKFENYPDVAYSSNGLTYLKNNTNAYLSCDVVEMIDCGTHTLFIAQVTEAHQLSNLPSCTYQYYFDHIKPSLKMPEKKKGWVCKICGYVYEGEELPADFICPLCKHGAEDFEKIE